VHTRRSCSLTLAMLQPQQQQQQQQQTPVAVSTVHITAAQSPAHPSILPAVMRIAQERFARPSSLFTQSESEESESSDFKSSEM